MNVVEPLILKREGNVIFVEFRETTPVDFLCPYCDYIFPELVQLSSLPDAITCPGCFGIFE